MRNNQYKSWPKPLLALAPVRLKPLGWLNDMLPLRPPSLWRGRGLHKTMTWQPDMAEISWLFAAYSMLGVEVPAPRIEHRSHVSQRSATGKHLSKYSKGTTLTKSKSSTHKQPVAKQRPGLRSANKPLVIPNWGTDVSMRTLSPSTNLGSNPLEQRSSTSKQPVANNRSVAQRKKRSSLDAPTNIPSFQWRSAENTPIIPKLPELPTILRTLEREDTTKRSHQTNDVARAKSLRSPKNLIANTSNRRRETQFVQDTKYSERTVQLWKLRSNILQNTTPNKKTVQDTGENTKQEQRKIAPALVERRLRPLGGAESVWLTPISGEKSKESSKPSTMVPEKKKKFTKKSLLTKHKFVPDFTEETLQKVQKELLRGQPVLPTQARGKYTSTPRSQQRLPQQFNSLTLTNTPKRVAPLVGWKPNTQLLVETKVEKNESRDSRVSIPLYRRKSASRSEVVISPQILPLVASTPVSTSSEATVVDAQVKTTKQIRVSQRVPWRLRHATNKKIVGLDRRVSQPRDVQSVNESNVQKVTNVSVSDTPLTSVTQSVPWFSQHQNDKIKHLRTSYSSQWRLPKTVNIGSKNVPLTQLQRNLDNIQDSVQKIAKIANADVVPMTRFQSGRTVIAPVLAGNLVFPTPEIAVEQKKDKSSISKKSGQLEKSVRSDAVYPKSIVVKNTGYYVQRGYTEKAQAKYSTRISTIAPKKLTFVGVSANKVVQHNLDSVGTERNIRKDIKWSDKAVQISGTDKAKLRKNTIEIGSVSQNSSVAIPVKQIRVPKSWRRSPKFVDPISSSTNIGRETGSVDIVSTKNRNVVSAIRTWSPSSLVLPSIVAPSVLLERKNIVSNEPTAEKTQKPKSTKDSTVVPIVRKKVVSSVDSTESSISNRKYIRVPTSWKVPPKFVDPISSSTNIGRETGSVDIVSTKNRNVVSAIRTWSPSSLVLPSIVAPSVLLERKNIVSNEPIVEKKQPSKNTKESTVVSIARKRVVSSVDSTESSTSNRKYIRVPKSWQQPPRFTNPIQERFVPKDMVVSSESPATQRKQRHKGVVAPSITMITGLDRQESTQRDTTSSVSTSTQSRQQTVVQGRSISAKLVFRPQRNSTKNAPRISNNRGSFVPKIGSMPSAILSSSVSIHPDVFGIVVPTLSSVVDKTIIASGATKNVSSISSVPNSFRTEAKRAQKRVEVFRQTQRQTFFTAGNLPDKPVKGLTRSVGDQGPYAIEKELRSALAHLAQPKQIFLDKPDVSSTTESISKPSSQSTQHTVRKSRQQFTTGLSANTAVYTPAVNNPERKRTTGASSTASVVPTIQPNLATQPTFLVPHPESTQDVVSTPTNKTTSVNKTTPVSGFQKRVQQLKRLSRPNHNLWSKITPKSTTTPSTPVAPNTIVGSTQAYISPYTEDNIPTKRVSSSSSVGSSFSKTPKIPNLANTREIGVFLQPKKKEEPVATQRTEKSISKPVQKPSQIDKKSSIFMVDATGNLFTGDQATKKLQEMGYARKEEQEEVVSNLEKQMDKSRFSDIPSSFTWEAPADMVEQIVKEVRKNVEEEETAIMTKKNTSQMRRQSVIKEWTEEQLMSILTELASESPEAEELLRDVQLRVEEHFDFERFRKI